MIKKTKKQLKREILELKSSTPQAYRLAYDNLINTSIDNNMASGVLLQITGIGGKELTSVLIQDGLSDETIKAIKKDIKRSSDTMLLGKL